jgi:D-glycero-alpha-D-manno-heptose 1-phosphate guanylyltransferase
LTPKIAVLLVGGRGTRLRSVIADRPKVLAAASGKPFLSYLLDQLADAGVTRVILCVGYRGAEIQAAFGEGYAGMRLEYSQETTPLGTGGAIRLAWPLIASERFIAMNGDSFCEVSLGDLWVSHHARRAKATLVLTPKADTARYGRVSLCSDGLIRGFEEKGGTPGGGWVQFHRDVPCHLNTRSFPVGSGMGYTAIRAGDVSWILVHRNRTHKRMHSFRQSRR